MGHQSGLFQTVHGFFYVTKNKMFTRGVAFDIAGKSDRCKLGRSKSAGIDFDGLGGGEISPKIKIRSASGGEVGVFGHGSVK